MVNEALKPTAPAAESNQWSSRAGFLMAAIGSAVGLGSIWKFPYEVGENGGGAFLIFYLLGMVLVVIPLLLAEFAIGRRGGGDAVSSLDAVARAARRSPAWAWVAPVALAGGYLILTYYAVIAGMTLDYALSALVTGFAGVDAALSRARFAELVGDPLRLALSQAIFLAATVAIVARGVGGGIERACTVLMPVLFGLVLLLVGYGAVQGGFGAAARFMFEPRMEAVTARTAIEALGLGFFSIGVGLGAMITYAAYTRADIRLVPAAAVIVAGDTALSVLAGLAVFPFVFAHGLDPAEGASLVFVTLPIAFGAITGGNVIGSLFFALLAIAALASAMSLLELLVAPLVQRFGWRRGPAALAAGLAVLAGGVPTLLSFNLWQGVRPLAFLAGWADADLFETIDAAASNLLLPAAGIAFAVFAGHVMPAAMVGRALDLDGRWLRWLMLALRWVVPGAILLFLAAGFF
ncbi:NSS family neurotransmitter:Na+ symporter [Stella humosa]|uniref:Transporter n=1 Tax=Stella humosa TaxID=94 RepID=A0A3N1KTY7_9PROT|nr:sodium-dependent transporter [Stella humosa]ROP83444.1 NSS family neurotransmitter:Na+ symporter [Stella humosa]BBK33284.1 transporter [Stella humosa]